MAVTTREEGPRLRKSSRTAKIVKKLGLFKPVDRKCHFLEAPLDIRNIVYSMLLFMNKEMGFPREPPKIPPKKQWKITLQKILPRKETEDQKRWKTLRALLRTCQQVQDEVSYFMFSKNSFSTLRGLHSSLKTIHPRWHNFLRNVRIKVVVLCPYQDHLVKIMTEVLSAASHWSGELPNLCRLTVSTTICVFHHGEDLEPIPIPMTTEEKIKAMSDSVDVIKTVVGTTGFSIPECLYVEFSICDSLLGFYWQVFVWHEVLLTCEIWATALQEAKRQLKHTGPSLEKAMTPLRKEKKEVVGSNTRRRGEPRLTSWIGISFPRVEGVQALQSSIHPMIKANMMDRL